MGIQQMVMGGGAAPYELDGSWRCKISDPARLSKTFTTTGDRKTWTQSMWMKRSSIQSSKMTIWPTGGVGGANSKYIQWGIYSDNKFWYGQWTSIPFHSTSTFTHQNWMHVVLRVDTTNATPADTFRVYVDGSEIGPSITMSGDTGMNMAALYQYGASGANWSYPYDGWVADIHMVDGQSLGPSSFDGTEGGLYKPIAYTGTHGTNGYHLKFTGGSNFGADSSASGNNWTENSFTTFNYSTDVP